MSLESGIFNESGIPDAAEGVYTGSICMGGVDSKKHTFLFTGGGTDGRIPEGLPCTCGQSVSAREGNDAFGGSPSGSEDGRGHQCEDGEGRLTMCPHKHMKKIADHSNVELWICVCGHAEFRKDGVAFDVDDALALLLRRELVEL